MSFLYLSRLYGSRTILPYHHTACLSKLSESWVMVIILTIWLERDKGFEPSHSAWKADMLAIKHQSRIYAGYYGRPKGGPAWIPQSRSLGANLTNNRLFCKSFDIPAISSGIHFYNWLELLVPGAPGEARTRDPMIKSHVLFQLSYRRILKIVLIDLRNYYTVCLLKF